MAENKKSIVIYSDWIDKFEILSDEEAGKLIKHFFRYVNDKNPTAPDRITELSFIDIKATLKRDLVKWEKRAERSRENGKLGGRPKTQENQEEPKETQQVILKPRKPDSVNVSVNVNNNNSNMSSKLDHLIVNFITFFNSVGKRNFKPSKKLLDSLNARLKDYTKEEIKAAIVNAHKDSYHRETNFKHLTPEFILRPDKLDKFLNISSYEDNEPKGYTPQLSN